MSVCTNLGLDRSSRLAAYAGYAVLRARSHTYPLSSSHCPNEYFWPDRPSRLAAYSEQDRTTQDRTEAILEKYNIQVHTKSKATSLICKVQTCFQLLSQHPYLRQLEPV
jgi:hypothetical protein